MRPRDLWKVNRRIKRRHIFVLAYGRSGSTLLMNILNSVPNCRIMGENNNSLYWLYCSYKAVCAAQYEHGRNAHRETSPWRGISAVNSEQFAKGLAGQFVTSVLQPSKSDRIVGFKEIRYSQRDVPDIEEYLNFIGLAFGNVTFVVNHRKVEDVAKSKWWRSSADSIERISDIDRRFWSLECRYPLVHFEYDKAVIDQQYIKERLLELDLPYDRERIKRVMETKHSY